MIRPASERGLVEDHAVLISNATWADYERLLELRGERAVPRITFLEGALEIMSPSNDHERIKSFVGCLVEAYCLHAEIPFTPYGSWTLKNEQKEAGAEPDECYIFGERMKKRPDLAIEVEWTPTYVDKLLVYRKLGVAEVWTYRRDRISVAVLRNGKYVEVERSLALPELDLDHLLPFIHRKTAYEAIKAYTRSLERRGR